MDTPPYGYFISTRGESVETVGKNPVRTDGPVAPNASDVRPYERTYECTGPPCSGPPEALGNHAEATAAVDPKAAVTASDHVRDDV